MLISRYTEAMPAVPADLCIKPRWILPMTAQAAVLEDHVVVVRDGRILDVLSSAAAGKNYAPLVVVNRESHVLLPGLVNARTRIAATSERIPGPLQLQDGALLCIAEMLSSGTTCFAATGYFPEESARAATEQGMRALIGIPISEAASSWAERPADYLTRALNFRDEYRGHPMIATGFAPLAAGAISDATFRRIALLVDELDCGILLSLHESKAEIEQSQAAHGMRPIERMQILGLLTPALTSANMVHVTAADIALAERSGIAITLCLESNLSGGQGAAPRAWARSGLRMSVGTDHGEHAAGFNVWAELKLLALLSQDADSSAPSLTAWDVLAAATRGGAAALGLDAQIGTVEAGKWADLCCVDLKHPATLPVTDLARQLVFSGGRDLVSDVWVSGRQLLNRGALTRLDWDGLSARIAAWPQGH